MKLITLLTIASACLSAAKSQAQTPPDFAGMVTTADQYYRENKTEAAAGILLKMDSTTAGIVTDSIAAYGYFLLGNIEYRRRNGGKGLLWHQKALDWRARHLQKDHRQIAQSHEWIGNIYRYTMSLPYQALPGYEKALTILESREDSDPDEIRRLTYHLAATYRLIKDLDKAFRYGNKSLQLARLDSSNHLQLASHYNQLGTLFTTDNKPDSALRYFSEALKILSAGRPSFVRRYRYRSNLADAYREAGNYRKSESIQKENLADVLAHDPQSDLLGLIYYTLLKAAHLQQDYTKADEYALKAITAFTKSHGPGHVQVAEIYRYWGAVYRTQPKRAIPLLDSALSIYAGRMPVVEAVEQTNLTDWESLFITLGHKAFALRKAYPEQPGALRESLEYHKMALKVYQKYRFGFLSRQGIVRQAGQHEWFWEEALETVRMALLIAPEDPDLLSFAWSLIESGKSALLLAEFKNATIKDQQKIPDSLMNRYRELIGKQSGWLSQDPQNDSLYLIERDLSQWKNNMNTNYPLYGRLMARSGQVSGTEVQSKLGIDEVFLNFWEGSNRIYLSRLSENKQRFYSVEKDTLWQEKFHSYLNFLRHPHPETIGMHTAKTAAVAGHYLYNRLIAPAAIDPDQVLVISPHHNLEGLPFETLLTRPVEDRFFDYHTFPYLIRELSVYYVFSGTHLVRSGNPGAPSEDIQMAGIGWGDFRGQHHFSTLPASTKEVKEAATCWNGRVYLENQAHESLFRQLTTEVDLLHLALHGSAEPVRSQEPQLIFPVPDELHDGRLFLNEVYGLPEVPATIILNTCDSGEGLFASGEGTMSMARGFVFAGCNSVIANLWPLYDEAASKLMHSWHQKAAEGYPLHTALRQSKLAYLAQSSPAEAHPGYWAGTILQGSANALVSGKGSSGLLYLIIVAFIILVSVILILCRRQF